MDKVKPHAAAVRAAEKVDDALHLWLDDTQMEAASRTIETEYTALIEAAEGMLRAQTGGIQAHIESPPEAAAECDCRSCCKQRLRDEIQRVKG